MFQVEKLRRLQVRFDAVWKLADKPFSHCIVASVPKRWVTYIVSETRCLNNGADLSRD